ncbi:heterokaryon incompatibility protein-domain-containing protein [Hyaloscypha sp. PMI_1271]|nr:heterokaryon incompatibility protein-domain-containing protein [Hyaloscypha sp. PMI_1271]
MLVLHEIIEHKLAGKPELDSRVRQALQRDARRYGRVVKRSSEGEVTCPWYLGDMSAIPAVQVCDGDDIQIWKKRLGTEILEAAESLCELCARLCAIVSFIPKFQRASGRESFLETTPPSVPNPSNILAVELESWLVLHPWTSSPIGLKFLVVTTYGSIESTWISFYIEMHGADKRLDKPLQTSFGSSTNSEPASKFLGAALSNCLKHHIDCRPQIPGDRFIPSRLIDLSGYPLIRVTTRQQIETKPPHGSIEYFTLSHIWGQDIFLTLNSGTLEHLESGFEASELPTCFHDAINTTRRFGFQYLWIDSLCIIQDSAEDWLVQSCTMDRVYSFGICNIAACNANNAQKSLFTSSDPSLGGPFFVNCSWSGFPSTFSVFHDWFEIVSEYAPLYTRGWVLQERMLSPRTMHFATYPFWECQKVVLSEAYPNEKFHHYRHSWLLDPVKLSSKARSSPGGIWSSVVEDYSRCFLTKPTDKLVAISGIAKALHPGCEQDYFAGLWRETFLAHLLWKAKKILDGYDESTVRLENVYVAPSWSWASIEGPVEFDLDEIAEPLLHILEVTTTLASGDRFGNLIGGSLVVRGVLTRFPTIRSLFACQSPLVEQDIRFAVNLDDCGDFYYDNITWFLPVARVYEPESPIRGLLVQESSNASVEKQQFTRIGYAKLSESGEIANSGVFLEDWTLCHQSGENLKKIVVL